MGISKALWGVLVAVALVDFWIWQHLPGGTRVTQTVAISWALAAVVAAVVASIFSRASAARIIAGVVAAALAANIVNIVIGVARDSTSHNLFPFELVMTAVINAAGASLGALIAVPMRPKS